MVESKILKYNLKETIDNMLDKRMTDTSIAKKITEYLHSKGINDSISNMNISRYRRGLMRDTSYKPQSEELIELDDLIDDINVIVSGINPANKRASIKKLNNNLRKYRSQVYMKDDLHKLSTVDANKKYLLEVSNRFCRVCQRELAIISLEESPDDNKEDISRLRQEQYNIKYK